MKLSPLAFTKIPYYSARTLALNRNPIGLTAMLNSTITISDSDLRPLQHYVYLTIQAVEHVFLIAWK